MQLLKLASHGLFPVRKPQNRLLNILPTCGDYLASLSLVNRLYFIPGLANRGQFVLVTLTALGTQEYLWGVLVRALLAEIL